MWDELSNDSINNNKNTDTTLWRHCDWRLAVAAHKSCYCGFLSSTFNGPHKLLLLLQITISSRECLFNDERECVASLSAGRVFVYLFGRRGGRAVGRCTCYNN